MKRFKISNFDVGMPTILAGAGILTLIICLFFLIPEKTPSPENSDNESLAAVDALARMENRIAELENRLNSMPAASEMDGTSSPDVLSENTVQLQSLSDQMAGIQKKIDYIDKRQGNLEERVVALTAAAPTVKAGSQAVAKPAVKKDNSTKQALSPSRKQVSAVKPAAAEGSVKYHLVAAGETRYGIAQKYGLTVAQLDSLNGFSAATVIQPGQKIVVQR